MSIPHLSLELETLQVTSSSPLCSGHPMALDPRRPTTAVLNHLPLPGLYQDAKKSSARFMLSSTSDFYCCSYSEQETPSLWDTKGSTINIVSSVCLRFSTADAAHEVTCSKITEITSPCVRQGADLDMRFLKLPAGLPQSYIWVPFLQACYTDKE